MEKPAEEPRTKQTTPTRWKGKISGKVYEIGETYITISSLQRKIAGVRRYLTKNGEPFYKIVNDFGAELEEVEPVLEPTLKRS